MSLLMHDVGLHMAMEHSHLGSNTLSVTLASQVLIIITYSGIVEVHVKLRVHLLKICISWDDTLFKYHWVHHES